MHYWRDLNFKGLLEIGNSPDIRNKFPLYALYCEQRERGLRKLSIETINRFISEAERWSERDKFEFVSWILPLNEKNPNIYDLIPQPLRERFIKPVLKTWLAKEPNNPKPLRFINTFDSLRKALQLDPKDEKAAELFIKKVVNQLAMSTHELPDHGYLGDIDFELSLVNEGIAVVEQIKSKSEKLKTLLGRALRLRELLQSWQDFILSKEKLSFKEWATRYNRIYDE